MSRTVGGWWQCWGCGNSQPGCVETHDMPTVRRIVGAVPAGLVPLCRVPVRDQRRRLANAPGSDGRTGCRQNHVLRAGEAAHRVSAIARSRLETPLNSPNQLPRCRPPTEEIATGDHPARTYLPARRRGVSRSNDPHLRVCRLPVRTVPDRCPPRPCLAEGPPVRCDRCRQPVAPEESKTHEVPGTTDPSLTVHMHKRPYALPVPGKPARIRASPPDSTVPNRAHYSGENFPT